eukprot:2561414-Amphidinium_carterae.4
MLQSAHPKSSSKFHSLWRMLSRANSRSVPFAFWRLHTLVLRSSPSLPWVGSDNFGYDVREKLSSVRIVHTA